MIKRTTLALLVGLYSYVCTQAQSIHFSDYSHAAHSLSPALIGDYSGSLKVGTTTREQYRAFISNPFKTTTAFVDAPIAAGLPENQWLGVGAEFSNTEAGDLSLQRLSTRLGLSYHRALDKRFKTVVGLGFQLATINNSIKNREAAKFEDEILGLSESLDQNLLRNQNSTDLVVHTGAYLKKRFNKTVSFHGGISIQNISVTEKRLPFTYGIYGQWSITKSKKISLHPSFIFQTHSGLTNAVAFLGLKEKNFLNKDITIEYRLGYRLRDALIAGFRIKKGQWSAGLHYDLTVSSASNYNGLNGAFEIGLARTFIIYPKVKEKVIHICPRL